MYFDTVMIFKFLDCSMYMKATFHYSIIYNWKESEYVEVSTVFKINVHEFRPFNCLLYIHTKSVLHSV